MLSFGDAASEPDAAAVQHDLRIAAKRLRYVLEFTGACFGPEADRARAAGPGTCNRCSATSTTAT